MIQSESGRIYEVGDDPDPVAEANEQLGGAAQAAMDAALAFVRSPRAPGELRGHPAAEQRWIEPTAPGFGLSYPWVGQATGRGMSARAASSGESDVTIIVTDSVSNSPLANVDITAWLYDYATDDSTSTQVRTDAGGHAVLTGLAEGDLDIRVEDHVGSHVAAWDSNYLDGTSDITIPVALTPGGGVAGTISDAVTGDPVAGVCASLMAGHDPDGWTGAGGCSDVQGHFQTTGVAPGAYTVVFDDDNNTGGPRYVSNWYNAKLDQASADLVTVSLGVATPGIDSQMEAGAYLTGHVMSVAGAGIADAWVEVQDATTRDYLVWAETAADGSFRAGPVASGSFVVRVGAADYLPNWVGGSATPTAVAVTTAQVRAGADVAAGDVALELGGVISGVVTDVVTGDPVRGCVSVYLGAEDWETGDGCAADDGQYRISGLPLGTYQVQFWADGYGTEWFNDKTTRNDANPIAITTSERSATASAALEPSGRVSGRIIDDATGEPITDPADDCLTSVRLWSSGQYVVASTCVAPDGSYSITADSPGIYRLEVRNSGDYATRWYVAATAFAEAAPLALAPRVVLSGTDVRLVPAASISGTITSPGPTDNLSANLYTKPASQSGYPSYVSGATPDATGKYKFRGVTPGTYLVQFQDYSQAAEPRWYTNSATWQGATAVVVGQSQQLTGIDVDLPKAASITLAINGPEGALTTNVCWTLGGPGQFQGFYRADFFPEQAAEGLLDGGRVRVGRFVQRLVGVAHQCDPTFGRVLVGRAVGAILVGARCDVGGLADEFVEVGLRGDD